MFSLSSESSWMQKCCRERDRCFAYLSGIWTETALFSSKCCIESCNLETFDHCKLRQSMLSWLYSCLGHRKTWALLSMHGECYSLAHSVHSTFLLLKPESLQTRHSSCLWTMEGNQSTLRKQELTQHRERSNWQDQLPLQELMGSNMLN